jgi:SAM-dependent methyltransferase
MGTSSRNGATTGPAEAYNEHFVPALFGPWGEKLARLAQLGPGDEVLDVACGTGALTRAVHALVRPGGSVTGVDANDEMLTVARRIEPSIAWVSGTAEALPFADSSFAAVVSQAALMFFTDKLTALREMQRVLRPGGRLTLAVWDRLDNAPGYAALTQLLAEMFGPATAAAMEPPFALGDTRLLATLFADAGLTGATIDTITGSATYPSVDAMIGAESACVWTLGGLLDEEQFSRLRLAAAAALEQFVRPDGSVVFDVPAHVVTYVAPG